MRNYRNYNSWLVKVEDFPSKGSLEEKLAFFLRYAILAPSSHNSQPWLFSIKKNSIFIGFNKDRMLPVADPHQRLAYISLGCVLENILIAADYFSFTSSLKYLDASFLGEGVLEIILNEEQNTHKPSNHLIFAIPKRVTNRNKYKEIFPSEEFARELISTTPPEDVMVHIIKDQGTKEKVADILMNWRLELFDRKEFRYEMGKYKKTNFTQSPLGMPGFTMGIPDIISFVTPFLIKHFNVMKKLYDKEKSLLTKHTPLYIFLTTKTNSKKDWIEAGRKFQRIALKAETVGIQTAINSIPEESLQLQGALKTKDVPQIFFRFGHAEKIAFHSPRLYVEDFIRH